jgi:ADP-heptose:LPS heptosyltransferase
MENFSKQPIRIAIFRALQLGDLLATVPALRALRAANPRAEIQLVGLPWAKQFAQRFSKYLSGWIEFPGFPGFPEIEPNIRALPAFLADMQSRGFDLALQMQGNGYLSNSLVLSFGARQTAGFCQPGNFLPDPHRYLPYPEGLPEPLRHLELLKHLGIPEQGTHLEFPISNEEWAALDRMQRKLRLRPGEYVILHPGARALERRWPPERFAKVGDALANQGYSVVLTGTREERGVTMQVAERMTNPVVDLSGQTGLGILAGLVAQARLLVCNDTGVSHIAAATKTPSVVLFSISDPGRWAPLNRALHRPVVHADLTYPEAVFEIAQSMLSRETVSERVSPFS